MTKEEARAQLRRRHEAERAALRRAHEEENQMTSQTSKQYAAEQHERAVARIKGVTEGSVVFTDADEKRLKVALYNIPMAGMPNGHSYNIEGKTVEDLALFLLGYGEAFGESLREAEALRTRVNALEAEKRAFRRFIGTEQ